MDDVTAPSSESPADLGARRAAEYLRRVLPVYTIPPPSAAPDPSAVEALRLGATDYLTKPFDSLVLLAEKVHRAIQNHRAQQERDRLLDYLREFQAELGHRDEQVSRQRTEIEMFNEILELRVEQATKDVRRERDELLARTSGGGASREEAEIVGAEMALVLVRDIQLADSPESAPLRGELQRVVRQLETHIRMLRGPPKS